MKKLALATLATLATLAALSTTITGFAQVSTVKYDTESIRASLLKTIIVNHADDTFILMDDTGNTWVMDEIDDTEVGDFYLAAVATQHTSDPTDDVILSLTYTDTCHF